MSELRLQGFYDYIKETILKNQDSITGLIPATNTSSDSWVRDNCYAVLSVWGLSLAYRKIPDLDEDRSKGYELEKCAIKLMRGILICFLKQADKVEAFKNSQKPTDSLHAKFDAKSCNSIVDDHSWGHLQIDAISLFLLTLAQMTASGINIIWSIDEVSFIQNLVFYIEMAYRIPDYGIWERGDKTNHGLPELNTSSVGMAKAALEALSELDLFGPHGGPNSIVQVFPDECEQCQAVLESMLPRESYSKEIDSALISIISYPAFAVNDEELIETTRMEIIEHLLGKYGCKRFMRDGFRTPKEDVNRLHYELHELRVFEKIECEWPMFFAYLALDACFRDQYKLASEYMDKLEAIMVTLPSGFKVVPESYAVRLETMELEIQNHGSQVRDAKGKMPHIWSQSLYLLAKLVTDNVITPGEIDPLGRRMLMEPKPDLVVQVSVLVENQEMKKRLLRENIICQTNEELLKESGIKVFPAKTLVYILKGLGKSETLHLKGRVSKDIGVLATSRLYLIGNHMVAFQPQFMDTEDFYISMDFDFIVDVFRTTVAYLRRVWSNPGRPTLIIPLFSWFFKPDGSLEKSILNTLMKLKNGYIYGTRVKLGVLGDFVSTSFVTKLAFLHNKGDDLVRKLIPSLESPKKVIRQISVMPDNPSSFKSMTLRRKSVALTSAVLADLQGTDIFNECHNKESMLQEWINTGKLDDDSYSSKPSHFLKSGPTDESRLSTVHLKNLVSVFADKTRVDNNAEPPESNEYLLERLRTTNELAEQGEILFILYQREGLDWEADISDTETYTIKQMLIELYENAGKANEWWLVRFISGLLNKRIDILAKSLTDLLIRQKQVTVGLPPEPREIVISSPMAPKELSEVIQRACGEDYAICMLTQEILVYLAMFARTEPQLLSQMLRIRVGLIIQVMASELGRALDCTATQASSHLFDLSPSQTKVLLQHILAGREFTLSTCQMAGKANKFTKSILGKIQNLADTTKREQRKSGFQSTKPIISISGFDNDISDEKEVFKDDHEDSNRIGQWLRRRKIDGALNRVPFKFYEKLWKVIDRTQAISIGNRCLGNNLTKEMTKGEIKFALVVESIINTVPIPEYRQLIVEALCVLSSLVEMDVDKKIDINYVIPLDKILSRANYLFLLDQVKFNGDSTMCCTKSMTDERRTSLHCRGANQICVYLYDTSPSGRYGTMTYLLRSFAETIPIPFDKTANSLVECQVQ